MVFQRFFLKAATQFWSNTSLKIGWEELVDRFLQTGCHPQELFKGWCSHRFGVAWRTKGTAIVQPKQIIRRRNEMHRNVHTQVSWILVDVSWSWLYDWCEMMTPAKCNPNQMLSGKSSHRWLLSYSSLSWVGSFQSAKASALFLGVVSMIKSLMAKSKIRDTRVHSAQVPLSDKNHHEITVWHQESGLPFFKSTIFVQDQKLYRLPLVVNIASMGAVGSRWDIRTIKPGLCAAAASTNFYLGSHTGHTELTSSVQKPVPCDQF